MAASTTTGNFKVIGTRPIRHDGVDKVTGRAKYGADYAFPGMLHGKVLRSPHAHANIKSINVDKALKLPGVKAIVTAQDLAAGCEQDRAGRRNGDQSDVPVDEHPRARQGRSTTAMRSPRSPRPARISPKRRCA